MSLSLSALQDEARAAEARIHDELRRLLSLAPGVRRVDLELQTVPMQNAGDPEPRELLTGVRIRLTL